MAVLRQDPTTGGWVIVAPDRRKRPRERSEPRPTPSDPSTCPLCPGHEGETPPEVLRLPGVGPAPWGVRVVPNKFAVLSPAAGPAPERRTGPLFVERDGAGHHELIIDSPHHDRRMAELGEREVALVLEAYHARYRALREDASVAYVLVFKNAGPRAGASLVHPHSQLLATPMVPRHVEERQARARAHHAQTGRCLYADLIDAEREAGARVVAETNRFVAFCPYAAGVPFETWVAPKAHAPSFGTASALERAELAGLVRTTLGALDAALDRPDFNYALHTAPMADAQAPYYRWHLQILPRVATLGGIELGAGLPVNTVLPEDAAAQMRASLGPA